MFSVSEVNRFKIPKLDIIYSCDTCVFFLGHAFHNKSYKMLDIENNEII